jgi:hypothetical protein
VTPPTPESFVDRSGITRLQGTIDPPPGGGSQPGSWQQANFLFNEPDDAHADLVATFDVPAGATVVDVKFIALVGPWDASAKLKMGDTANPTGYVDDTFGVLQNTVTYDPIDLQSGAYSNAGGQGFTVAGTYAEDNFFYDNQGPGIYYPEADTITMTVSEITSGGGGGAFLIAIIYAAPATPVVAT